MKVSNAIGVEKRVIKQIVAPIHEKRRDDVKTTSPNRSVLDVASLAMLLTPVSMILAMHI
eukprot:1714757-Ditylum_brightwellii.AAC.1